MKYTLCALLVLFGLSNIVQSADIVRIPRKGTVASDRLHEPLTEFARFTEAFNTNKSLTKGISEYAHTPLQVALISEVEQNAQDETGLEAKKLFGAFNNVTKQIRSLQPLYFGLQAVRTIESPAKLCEQLHQDLSTLSDEQNGRLAQFFAPLILQQLAATATGDDFITMGELLNQCNNSSEAAVVLGLKHQDSAKKDLIGRLILGQRQTLDPQIVALMKQEVTAPEGLTFCKAQLGTLLKQLKVRLNGSKPQRWVDTVPGWSINIFNPQENAIYAAFQTLHKEKGSFTSAQDLKKLLADHCYTEDKDIKHFMSQLERYEHQLESRPNCNFTFGLSSATDTLRYADHKMITKQLNAHMHRLYPDVLTELDEAILLNNQDPKLVTSFVRSHALLAVINGVFKEFGELETNAIQNDLTNDAELQDFSAL